MNTSPYSMPVPDLLLSGLQTLELSYNRLAGVLPETFGLATSLMYVDLSYNEITALPTAIVALVKVRLAAVSMSVVTATDRYCNSIHTAAITKSSFQLAHTFAGIHYIFGQS
jgi:hypothetical protein